MESLMQQALGEQWEQLPPILKQHYAVTTKDQVHIEEGFLDIDYPNWMQPYLTFLRTMGALLNRRGTQIPTRIERRLENAKERWQRTLSFPEGKVVSFNSLLTYAGGNELVEYTNAVQALRMAVSVEEGKLYYTGKSFLLQLGPIKLNLPEWLILGHSSIVEQAVDDTHFAMDFRITHPWLGELFSYKGVFKVVKS